MSCPAGPVPYPGPPGWEGGVVSVSRDVLLAGARAWARFLLPGADEAMWEAAARDLVDRAANPLLVAIAAAVEADRLAPVAG
jgi:hypothetical protein